MHSNDREKRIVVKMPENVTVSGGVESLKENLNSLRQQGYSMIVLDFTSLTMLDAAGLNMLLALQRRLKESGGELRIVNITSRHLQELFRKIELEKVIPIEDK